MARAPTFSRRKPRSLSDDGDSSSYGSRSTTSGVERSSGTGNSTNSNRTGDTTDDDLNTIKNSLAKEETKQVFRLRVAVVLILIAAATSVSLAVYFITKNSEKEEFEIQYTGVAKKILDNFEKIIVEMSAVSGLAVAATTSAEQMQLFYSTVGVSVETEYPIGWPFITLSDFQQRAGNVKSVSGAIYVSVNPIVSADEVPLWESYVQSDANKWIDEGLAFQEAQGLNDFDNPVLSAQSKLTKNKVDPLHTHDANGKPFLSRSDGPFLPRWQTSPVLETGMVNENLFETPEVAPIARNCIEKKSAVLGGFVMGPPGSTSSPNHMTSFFATLRSIWEGKQVDYLGDPMTHLAMPIFDTLSGDDRKVVAVLKSTIHWQWFLHHILPKTNEGVQVVLENKCDGNFTYLLKGDEAFVVGFGDLHDPAFDKYHHAGTINMDVIKDGTAKGIPLSQGGCPYTFHVYSTEAEESHYVTNDPIIIALSVASVFLFTLLMFFTYDALVERRQRLVLAKATQSTALVSSLFPRQVRDRLMAMETDKRKGDAMIAPSHRLKTFVDGLGQDSGDQPIADFFPNCTVCYANIAGFTAWSSTREPAQVFVLLQTVYQNFDIIAKRRRVFKVETIADSYLAVTGLPEAQKYHASIMAKFAWDCLIRIGEITKELEVSLGPDTGDLSMRFGIHSGSVTAGVLKGDRARFQLFGDTVNTAASMESTCMKGRIQVSEASAELLKQARKDHWLVPREDKVSAKGKGLLSTYWLVLKNDVYNGSVASSVEDIADLRPAHVDLSNRHNLKEARLVDWVADILLEHIKKMRMVHERVLHEGDCKEELYYKTPPGKICLDEVQEAIHMPKFDARVMDAALDSSLVEVPTNIVESLQEYVALIAKSYRDNPFHNFEHACHVTMSVNKLLSRVVAPDLAPPDCERLRRGRDEVAAQIHNFTHGITSDPLAVFAIVFSALIHDVDHQGISNMQLIKEDPGMGQMYRGKSVAEQNSLDVAWDIFMSNRFSALRRYIFVSRAEMMRFRQLIVNVVLATDIFDKDIGDLRKARWQRAFHGDGTLPSSVVNDLRATIVMEHIIQASDVSHTMQHWHVYQKWNHKLFNELYQAWKNGRMGADPRTFWYKGELGFFDNYIIPLANKLKECNVFGVSSDEYLGYALRNRAEWEERGEQIMQQMIEECELSEHSAHKERSEHKESSLHDEPSINKKFSIHADSPVVSIMKKVP